MTDKEKRELKEGVISIFKRFNILDRTATIGGLRDDILRYIDSMQEEPVFKVGDRISFKHCKENRLKIIKVGDKGYFCEDGAFLHFDNQYLWKLAEEPVSEELEKCKGCNNFSMCNKCMDGEQWTFIEEKGSEELENKIQDFFDRWMEDSEYNQAVMPNFCCASLEDRKNIARHFAKWQKEQFENNRLKHCDSITEEQYNLEVGFVDQHLDKNKRIPTFLDAIEYGMRIQKQQMMANATDAVVHIDAGGYPYIPQLELYDYDKDVPLAKEGDKYKVVLINED